MTLHKLQRRLIGIVAIAAVLISSLAAPLSANAAQITSRSVTISNSNAAQTAVSNTFAFTLPTAGTLGSIGFVYCTTASGACTTPTGLDTTAATLTAQTGQTGFSINNTTNGAPYITRVAAAGSGAVTYTLSNITNPTNPNETFFVRLTSYTGTDGSTGPVDAGTIASSTTNSIVVTATVDETFSFCTSTVAIAASCTGATGSTVNLGTLLPSTTGTGTSYFGGSTNAGSGWGVTYNGATLTSGANTITACAAACTSTVGTEQYGINLTNQTGTGSLTSVAPYNSAQYKFLTNDTVATTNVASNYNSYQVNYIANIAGVTEPGIYTSTVNYVGTPLF